MSDNIKSFLQRNTSLLKVALIFLAGILLIAFSGSHGAVDTPSVSQGEELSQLCSSVFGVGDCEVIISYGEAGEVAAVAIICEGADSPTVRKTLVDMIGSLYGIGSNRISIVKSK